MLLMSLAQCPKPQQKVHADLFTPLKTETGKKLHPLHDRLLNEVCRDGGYPKQGVLHCGLLHLQKVDLLLGSASGNYYQPRQRILHQANQGSIPAPDHALHHNSLPSTVQQGGRNGQQDDHQVPDVLG